MPKKMLTNKRIHILYHGSVQGVGFRYTAERLAASLGLSGWAKNLPGGQVEIICEGREQDIETFLQKINETFKSCIRDTDVAWSDAMGEFDGFDIRF